MFPRVALISVSIAFSQTSVYNVRRCMNTVRHEWARHGHCASVSRGVPVLVYHGVYLFTVLVYHGVYLFTLQFLLILSLSTLEARPGSVNLAGWLNTNTVWMRFKPVVTHPSTNWARRRLTSWSKLTYHHHAKPTPVQSKYKTIYTYLNTFSWGTSRDLHVALKLNASYKAPDLLYWTQTSTYKQTVQ